MKQLADVLSKLSYEKLRHVYYLWGMSKESTAPNSIPHSYMDNLLERTKDAIAARFVWERLSAFEQCVLYRLLVPIGRKGIAYNALLQKTELAEAQLSSAIDTLIEATLVYQELGKTTIIPAKGQTKTKVIQERTIYPFKEIAQTLYDVGYEEQWSLADRTAMTIDEVLTPVLQVTLILILQRYQMDYYQYAARTQLRVEIIGALKDPVEAFSIVEQLEAPARNLLKWLCAQRGKATFKEVRTYTGYDDSELFTQLHALSDYALAFDSITREGRILFIPSDMYEPLKHVLEQTFAPLPPAELMPLTEPPTYIREGDTLVQYDMAIIIGATYQQTLEPTQAGHVPKRLAAKIYPLLHGFARYLYMNEDNVYMEMLFTIAVLLDLLCLSSPVLQDVKQHYEAGPALDTWSKHTLLEQSRQLLAHWQKDYNWYDLRGGDSYSTDPYSWNPLLARTAIQTYLQRCTPGQWYSVDALLQTIWVEDPLALRHARYGGSNQQKQKKPTSKAERIKWMNNDGQIYLGSLASTLYELGLVTLGFSTKQPEVKDFELPNTFMITELGAAVFAKETPAVPEPTSPTEQQSLVVQPNFELLLLSPNMPTLYTVLPFAQVNQIERVSRLTLTRQSVTRGMSMGKSIEQMQAALQRCSQKELPQNVEYTMRDWTKQYKGARLTQTILLETSSESLADELCEAKSFQQFSFRRLGPLAIAANGDINTLRRVLDKEGIIINIVGQVSPASRTTTYGMRR